MSATYTALKDEFNELAMMVRFVDVMSRNMDIMEDMSAQEVMDYLLHMDVPEVEAGGDFPAHIFGAAKMLLHGHIPQAEQDLSDFNKALRFHLKSEDLAFAYHAKHFGEDRIKKAVPDTANNEHVAATAYKMGLKNIAKLAQPS